MNDGPVNDSPSNDSAALLTSKVVNFYKSQFSKHVCGTNTFAGHSGGTGRHWPQGVRAAPDAALPLTWIIKAKP